MNHSFIYVANEIMQKQNWILTSRTKGYDRLEHHMHIAFSVPITLIGVVIFFIFCFSSFI